MIRKLNEGDRHAALGYLANEPAYNTFAIGDIENFGFDCEFQEVWGEFDARGAFRALVLRYHSNHVVYSLQSDHDVSAIAELLSGGGDDMMLSGKASIAAPLAADLGLDQIRRQYLAELVAADDLPTPDAAASIEWATADTFDDVMELQRSVSEFRDLMGSSDALRHNEESGTGRTVLARKEGLVVSCASSAAECSRSAMIIGVCTAAPHRGRGLATACTAHLCHALLDEGKVVCLFYDNPAAGRIYRRIGFRDVGHWVTATRGPGRVSDGAHLGA